ncbi:demethylmenaquinone methyltransferase/2-methoxy-6-polyprenyl-1,4-benzoquinol methylase [Tamilnaduibacter salinus]|uniref:Demethylmenaquinone methyltransferase/2-methoxy-6-polyprenyl-1,4-benzoquinol methylase n=1 Tax=Tamilnaduibacter salinus TaxID=1484056 RepID=A0A2A2I7Y9_9GAMM|nr:class I SAM-dependent methyltransferase [Tamilnaduibacter salinus]PAV27163.1 SAM-dependent methyltransferase [Tamilnaduibacter salinus]PVY79003.1 demethylmenaquinone methyltransferase/2-methoxy-6-polyprenyl-1,4-benzoquinol methylase [Tamilnaduibacter salinus]
MQDKYKYIGPLYDFLSAIYSGRNIHRCKNAMLDSSRIQPGTRVLFAGVGHGRDAIHAAELGADVTVVDISETMLKQFGHLQEKEAPHLSIRQVHDDILAVGEPGGYDMVVANFFLNVFDESTMLEVLEHLVKLARTDGDVVVGDFCYPTGNVFLRAFKQFYWYAAASIFWVLANNPWHSIYNYPRYMRELGLDIVEMRHFKLLNVNCYSSILGRKRASRPGTPPTQEQAGNAERTSDRLAMDGA